MSTSGLPGCEQPAPICASDHGVSMMQCFTAKLEVWKLWTETLRNWHGSFFLLTRWYQWYSANFFYNNSVGSIFWKKKSHRFTIFFFSPNFILHYVHYLVTMTSQDSKPIIGLEPELAIEWHHVCSWICFHKCKLSPGLNLENPSADIVRSFTLWRRD